MRDVDQKIRYNKSELALIKGLFSDDAEITYIIRKVLLQFELNSNEQKALDDLSNDNFKSIITKMFLPELEPDSPLFQLSNLVVGLEGDIKGFSPEGAWPLIQAKKLERNYLRQQLDILFGDKTKVKIVLADLANMEGDQETVYVNVVAWNWLASFVDSCLSQFKMLAGRSEESVEETQLRLKKDSAQ